MKLILTHQNADFDAIASQLAASKLYTDFTPVLPERLNRNVQKFITLYQNGLPFKIWDDVIKPTTTATKAIEQVILVDTQTLPDASLTLDSDTPLLIFDHHTRRAKNSDRVDFQGEVIGSTTTLLCEQLQKKNIPITSLEATLLALGIYEDTGSLTYDITTPRDITMASWLLSQNAALDTLRSFLAPPLSIEQQNLLEQLVISAESRIIHGQSIVVSGARSEIYIEQVNSVTHRLNDILDPAALFVVVEMPGGIQLVCRANGNVLDVGEIARMFGGGGHAVAAAAHLENQALEHVIEKLWSLITSNVQPISTVAELMSYGTQTVDANALLVDIIQQMRRIGHEGFPVIDAGKVIGLLTRRDADRALEHQLNKTRVRDVMNSGEVTIKASDSVSTLEQLMVDSGWGQIPVIDAHNTLIGIVTRTDLIKHWAKSHPASAQSGYPSIEQDTILQVLGATFARLLDAVAGAAQSENLNVYVVGGVVRDVLLNRPNYDIDFVVEGNAIQFVSKLVKQYGGTFSSFEPFGTAKWLLDAEVISKLDLNQQDVPHHIDFASSRNEFYERPTALPTVYSGSIKLDLHRRDFTINTLAVQISPAGMRGRILDFYNGMSDLNNGFIRVLHSLSFVDDPTRILRAVRFEQRLNFEIEARTSELITSALPMLERITGERIRNELTLLLNEPEPENGFRKLEQREILRAIHPTFTLSQNLGDYFQRVLEKQIDWIITVENLSDFLWHFVLISVNPEDIDDLCERLLFSQSLTKSFRQTAQLSQDASRLITLDGTISQLTRQMEQISDIALASMLVTSNKQDLKTKIRNYLTQWRNVKAITTGNDLQKMGLKPGPYFKSILDRLRDARLNGEVTTDIEEIRLRDSLITELRDDRI
ncbi:MAG: CBS domain-containing protein [Aggregatilineales bacterium]